MFWGLIFLNLSALADVCPQDPQGLLNHVVSHMKAQRALLQTAMATVHYISTSGKNQDTADYQRYLTAEGQIIYHQVDPTANVSKVIRMAVDRDSRLTIEQRRQLEFTDENYSFSFLGSGKDGEYLYKLTPLSSRDGLVNGQIALDPKTCEPIGVQGSIVVNNIFVRAMNVFQQFQVINGIYLPKYLQVNYRISVLFKSFVGSVVATSQYNPSEVRLNSSEFLYQAQNLTGSGKD